METRNGCVFEEPPAQAGGIAGAFPLGGSPAGHPGPVVQPVRDGSVQGRRNGVLPVQSPCAACTRVPDPVQCENKQCKIWRGWFLERWALLHRPIPRAVPDPCGQCVLPQELCHEPCRQKRIYIEERKKMQQ